MSHQRILQISDLHIDKSPRTGAVLDGVKRTLEESRLLPLDYLVVCGNITKNGRPEEFDLAAKALVHFAAQVLKKDDHVSQANRLMVVPGDRDVFPLSSELSPLHHFNQFYSAVRTTLGARPAQQPLSPDRPLVRRLKDVTLIGVPYWQGASAAALKKGIHAAAKAGSVVAYHFSKPTILASSQSPLMELGARRSLDQLKSVLELDLRIDFHLFGAAPVVLVTLEPFAFRHVGISTGPRAAGSRWPLRFNVLEIGPTSHAIPDVAASRESNPVSRSFAVISRKLERPGGKWDDERQTLSWATYLSTDKSVPTMRTFLHRTLVDVLNHWADTRELYLRIDHLPGSGVDKWLQQQDNEPVRELRAKHIFYRTLESDWGKVESDHKEVFRRLVDTMQELAQLLDSKQGVAKSERWAVFHDQVLPRIDPEDHSEWLKTVKAESQKQIGERGRFLYLVPQTPYTSELTRLFPEARLSPALDSDSRSEFLRLYDTVVPFRTHVLERLTGGCLGFGAQLLEEVQNQFVRWSDAKEILDADLEALIVTALESGPMQQLTREFYNALESLQGGHVLALIRQKVVRRMLSKQSITLSDIDTPVPFSYRELQRKVQDRTRLKAVLDVLVNHGVIVKEDGSDEYQVLALAPFLVNPIVQEPAHVGDVDLGETSPVPLSAGEHVFISYSGKRSLNVLNKFVSDLEARNIQYWYDKRLTERGTKYHPQILEAIQKARFAVLLLDTAFAGSEYIKKHEWPAIRSAMETRQLEVFTIRVEAAVQTKEFDDLVSLNGNEPLSLKPFPRRRQHISEAAKHLIGKWEART